MKSTRKAPKLADATMTKRKVGRPSGFSSEVSLKICERLITGESLNSICKDPGMPCMASVMRWLHNNREFRENYDRAKMIGLEVHADGMLDIADDGRNDWMKKNDPDNPGYVYNGECVQRSRLRIDARKWILSKLLPRKYGDRLLGDQEEPIKHETDITHSFDDLRAAMAKKLGKA